MRKKLLALMMCATMVLGSSAVAFAAPSNDDYSNAKKILEQFNADKGNIVGEYDAKKENVTFSTQYVVKDGNESYTMTNRYAFTNVYGTYAKINSDGKLLQHTDGHGYEVTVLDKDNNKITTTATAAELDNSVVKFGDELYYATTTHYSAGDKVREGYAVNASVTLNSVLAADTDIVTLKAFDGKATGTINYGKDKNFINEYGIDASGYINLATSKPVLKLSSKVADGYWTSIEAASTVYTTDVANALANGTISKNAAAVRIDLYQTINEDNKDYNEGRAVEYGFKGLRHVTADVASHAVTFKADWLSQSQAKNANTVYLLDRNVPTYSEYFQRFGSIYKVSDLTDGMFSTNYLVSGTYIFDFTEAASVPDGATDKETPSTTSPSTSSPKTGDVAPIAALAVVMMGACGAMVVASKKRA